MSDNVSWKRKRNYWKAFEKNWVLGLFRALFDVFSSAWLVCPQHFHMCNKNNNIYWGCQQLCKHPTFACELYIWSYDHNWLRYSSFQPFPSLYYSVSEKINARSQLTGYILTEFPALGTIYLIRESD